MSDRIPLSDFGWLQLSGTEKDAVSLVSGVWDQPLSLPPDLDGRYGKLFAIGARYQEKTLIGEGNLFVRDGDIGVTSRSGTSGLKTGIISRLKKDMIQLWFEPIDRHSQET